MFMYSLEVERLSESYPGTQTGCSGWKKDFQGFID